MLRPCLMIAALAVMGLPAAAQGAPGTMLSVVSLDWNADALPDAAILIQSDDAMADLALYEGSYQGMRPVLTLPSVVFSGLMAGQMPLLAPRSDTSFSVITQQTGVGRTPWEAALTIAYRDGELRVAGYDYSFYDRIDLSHYGSCSVNLLTSRYTLTLGPGDDAPERTDSGATDATSFALTRLTDGYMPAVCQRLWP